MTTIISRTTSTRVDLADIVESPFDDTDVFDGMDDVVSEDDTDEDEYVVVEDD